MLSNQILQNSAPKFYCKTCDYYTCRKSSYDEHLLSTKHQKSTFSNHFSNQNLQKSAPEKFTCQFCNKEYKDKSMEEVFASYMYTASILHIISADVLQQMVQGYDCPASINKDGSVNKYVYLWAMITIIVVNAPQRKLFMKLPDTYDILVRNEYNNILDEFSNINFKSIDIFNVDASVQK